MTKYNNITESYNWLDDIWDFFSSPFILRCFWRYWNEMHPDDTILAKQFNLQEVKFVDFVRKVLWDKESQKDFLLEIKHLVGIYKQQFSDKEIICFLLCWIDAIEKTELTTESIRSIFSTDIAYVIETIWDRQYETQSDEEYPEDFVTTYQWLSILIENGFSPVNWEWNIHLGISEASPIYSFTQAIVIKSMRIYNIWKDWCELSEDEIDSIERDEVQMYIEKIKRTHNYLADEKPWQNIDEDLKPIIQKALTDIAPEQTNKSWVLEYLDTLMQQAEEVSRKAQRWKLSIVSSN